MVRVTGCRLPPAPEDTGFRLAVIMRMSSQSRQTKIGPLLYARPHDFRVDYKINPYMQDGVDSAAALSQWEGMVESVAAHADVSTVDYSNISVPGGVSLSELPDAVFVANHALPVPGENTFVLSQMTHEERAGEIPYFKQWAEDNGYETVELSDGLDFEGAGDGKWHPGNEILWLGYGKRTEEAAVVEINELLDAVVIPLELVSDEFYHLDVCFTPIDQDTVLIVEDAFTETGLDAINSLFSTVLCVPERETGTMAGNCARIRPSTIAIDEQNTETARMLEEHGVSVVTVDTSEFQKSGGSVDCLFLRLP